MCPAFVSGPLRPVPCGAAAQAQVATETTDLVGDFDGDGKSFTDASRPRAVPCVHSIRDPVQVQRFWDLGIPVYSDEPFPPLASTAATLETPTFSKRRRHAARMAGRSEGSTR